MPGTLIPLLSTCTMMQHRIIYTNLMSINGVYISYFWLKPASLLALFHLILDNYIYNKILLSIPNVKICNSGMNCSCSDKAIAPRSPIIFDPIYIIVYYYTQI